MGCGTPMPVKILYFAWVREKIGKAEEDRRSAGGRRDRRRAGRPGCKQRGPEYAEAFARADVIRAAIDKTHVKPGASLAGAREIAFFPPVTGG